MLNKTVYQRKKIEGPELDSLFGSNIFSLSHAREKKGLILFFSTWRLSTTVNSFLC